MKKYKQFWMRPEGISRPCVDHAAVYTEQDLSMSENKEFVLEGIHVIEHQAVAERDEIIKELKTELASVVELLVFSISIELNESLRNRFSRKVSSIKTKIEKWKQDS